MKRRLQETNKAQVQAEPNKISRDINQDMASEENNAIGVEKASLEDDVNVSSSSNGSNGPAKKRKRYSTVWNHFAITNDGADEWANCNYCGKAYPISGKSNGSTSNLIRHMKNVHTDIKNSTIPEEIEIIEFSQERYREALIKWIVVCNQPFTEVEQDAFLEMIKILNPAAITISSSTVKRDIIKKFEEKVKNMIVHLKKVPGKISFTIDAWTSKNVLPFMAIRAHWINSDWAYETVLLDFVHIVGSHDGKNFCSIFVDCLKRFEIPLSKVLALTMDNVGSNDTFIDFLRLHGIEIGVIISTEENRVRCMLHIFNLIVQDILADLKIPLNYEADVVIEDGNNKDVCTKQEVIEADGKEDKEVDVSKLGTIPKLRELVKKVRRSTQMRQKLEEHCKFYKMTYLVPIIDVATRWNSTFQMLDRAEYLKTPLRALCLSEKNVNSFLMTDLEWNELKRIKVLLAKFDRSSQLLSMQRHPTIAAYLPTFNWLQDSLESFISDNPGPMGNAAKNGLQKLQKYEIEVSIKSSVIPYVGTFLNPALKMNYFKEHSSNRTYQKDIQNTISDLFERNYANKKGADAADNTVEQIHDEFFLHMFKRVKPKQPKEFQQYLSSPLAGVNVNVLDFWRAQQNELPHLSNMARDYLAVQSSSVSVERDFSDGVDLVTPTRCSLKAQTIRSCMCLKSWHNSDISDENQ